ncbi:class I SAM-dependent methyltransferase [Halosegnis marinus]|uniref:Class I SAM-dependent methyltransferase n=1 Tax=Halosegnis marinus TaxID=3034023 RepID=A0ABD5ZPW6_9EURY|nr:class I SAM-dependent methyltransferase [Halosegnis sp. DT85]
MDPDEVRRDWAERSGDYSPAYYADIGPNEVSETLAEVLGHYVGEDAAILELGCASGRHLAYLRDHGYGNLAGIDVNPDSFDVMRERYPGLAEAGEFRVAAIEEYVPDLPDDAFDVVFAVETLQHVPPDNEWVFDEIARVTGDLLITAENEGNGPQRGRAEAAVSYVDDDFPLFHRNWKEVFSARGLAQLIREPTPRDTIRVFRAP